MTDYPKREGYVLSYDGEMLYQNWQEMGGCRCWNGCAPCSSCTHEGHPISLEENDEVWEPETKPAIPVFAKEDYSWLRTTPIYGYCTTEDEEEVENMSRDNIVNKAGSSSGDPPKVNKFKSGDKVRRIDRPFNDMKVGDIDIVMTSRVDDDGDETLTFKKSILVCSAKYFELVSEEPKTVKHTAYVKFPDYHKTYAYILPDSIYEKIREYKDVKLYVAVNNQHMPNGAEIKVVHLVDIGLNYVDPVATKEIAGVHSAFNPQGVKSKVTFDDVVEINVSSHVHQGSSEKIVKAHSHVHGIIRDTITTKPLEEIYNEWKSKQSNQFLNNKEETNMSNINRRIVNIEVVDQDSALDVEDSLVIIKKEVVTQDSDEVTIREWLSTGELKEALELHNKKRTDRVNRDILNRTGNKVYLEAIKVKDLTIRVV